MFLRTLLLSYVSKCNRPIAAATLSRPPQHPLFLVSFRVFRWFWGTRPFSRNTVNTVLTTLCCDKDPNQPWEFRFAPRRKPLNDEQMVERAAWADRLRRANGDPSWYFRNITWVDLCSSVLPGEPRKAAEQVHRGKSKKRRLMSPGARGRSQDLGGTEAAQKQCSRGDRRVWFVIAMARGH